MKSFSLSILSSSKGPDWGYIGPNRNVIMAKAIHNKGPVVASQMFFEDLVCKPIRVATPPKTFRASKDSQSQPLD